MRAGREGRAPPIVGSYGSAGRSTGASHPDGIRCDCRKFQLVVQDATASTEYEAGVPDRDSVRTKADQGLRSKGTDRAANR